MRAAHLCLLRDIYKAWIPWSNTDESVCGGGAGCRVGCEGKGHMRSGSSTRLHTQTTPKHTVSEPMQLINANTVASKGRDRQGLAPRDCWRLNHIELVLRGVVFLLPPSILEHAEHLQSVLCMLTMSFLGTGRKERSRKWRRTVHFTAMLSRLRHPEESQLWASTGREGRGVFRKEGKGSPGRR